jgi:hypothetical protein
MNVLTDNYKLSQVATLNENGWPFCENDRPFWREYATTKWNAEELQRWLGSQDKKIVYLEGCDHVLPMDLKKEEVAYYYAEFVCKIAAENMKA